MIMQKETIGATVVASGAQLCVNVLDRFPDHAGAGRAVGRRGQSGPETEEYDEDLVEGPRGSITWCEDHVT